MFSICQFMKRINHLDLPPIQSATFHIRWSTTLSTKTVLLHVCFNFSSHKYDKSTVCVCAFRDNLSFDCCFHLQLRTSDFLSSMHILTRWGQTSPTEPILLQQDPPSEDKTQPCSKLVTALSPWMSSHGSLHSSSPDPNELPRKASTMLLLVCY